jgi:hypothetical protein
MSDEESSEDAADGLEILSEGILASASGAPLLERGR